MACSSGLMVVNMKEDGRMENNTESELTHQPVVKPNKDNGKKERDSIGSKVVIQRND